MLSGQSGLPPCSNPTRKTRFWCWGCYENIRGKANHRGHLKYRSPPASKPYYWSQEMKKPISTGEALGKSDIPDDTTFAKDFPALWEYLTHDTYDDGSSRERSTIKLRVESGRWLLAVNNEDARQSAYTTGTTLKETLKACNKALQDETAEFRSWGGTKKKK